MSWLKIDDGCDEHPKIAALSDQAFRLWFAGLCYCGRQLTDGVIPLRQVPRLVTAEDWRALVDELTTEQVPGRAPLWEWEPSGQAVRMHHYLDYNPPSVEVLADRNAAKERMRVVRALRRLGLGDNITREQWEGLPADLQNHFKEGRWGGMERLRNGVIPAPVRANVRANVPVNVRPKFARSSPEVREPRPVPSPSLKEERQPPVAPRERGAALLDDDGGGTVKWAVTAKRPKGVTPRDLEAAVVRCLREIRQAEVVPEKSATAAGTVLSLWRALSRPELGVFADEVVLVARAAQMCGDRIFARDIRAEGWPEGTDRTFHVDTICRHAKWDDRLRVAQRWAMQTGRLVDGVPHVRRQRWLDPHDHASWNVHDQPVPMIQAYVGLARELFEMELAGDGLQAALARLEALGRLPGASADLTKVVRLALDEVGKW